MGIKPKELKSDPNNPNLSLAEGVETGPVFSPVVVGIDLGAMWASAAIWKENDAHLVQKGERIPACISFSANGATVGKPALANLEKDPANTILGFGKLLGVAKVDKDSENMLDVETANFDEKKMEYIIPALGKNLHATELLAIFMKYVMQEANKEFGEKKAVDVVVTVPHNSGQVFRKAVAVGVKAAGLNLLQLVSGTVATAINYEYDRITEDLKNDMDSDQQTIMVIDLGASKIEATAFALDLKTVKTIGTSGNMKMGGLDAVDRIKKFNQETYKTRTKGKDMLKHDAKGKPNQALQMQLVSKAFKELETLDTKSENMLEWVYSKKAAPMHFEMTQGDLDDILDGYPEELRKIIRRVILFSGVPTSGYEKITEMFHDNTRDDLYFTDKDAEMYLEGNAAGSIFHR